MNRYLFADPKYIPFIGHRVTREDLKMFMDLKSDVSLSSLITWHGKTAVIPITGFMSKNQDFYTVLFGGTSTKTLADAVDFAVESGAENIVFHVDSGGGTVDGIEEARRRIISHKGKTNFYTVADGIMASAAYYLGSVSDKVYASYGSLIGSIGVIGTITSFKESFENNGIQVKVISSPDAKKFGHFAEPISEESIKDEERIINSFYNQFVNAVAENRNISFEDALKFADGKVYISEEAEKIKMIDGQKTLNELLSEIEGKPSNEKVEVLLEAVETLSLYVSSLSEKYEGVKAKTDELLSQNDALKLESFLTKAAFVDKRIKISQIEEFTNLAKEKGNEFVMELVSHFSVNSAVPEQLDLSDPVNEESYNLTDSEKTIYKQFPSLRKKYNL